MSLCERPFSPFSFLFGSGASNRPSTPPSSSTASTSSSALIGDFEDTLRHRLLSLLPPVPERNVAVPLAYLSRAVGVLASTHAEATRIMLGNDDPTSGHAAVVSAAYLDTSSRILAFCNAASAEVEGLRRRRLLLAYALRLLADGGAGGGRSGAWRIEKAKKVIVEWEEEVEGGPKPAYDLNLPKAVLPEVHSLGGSDKCSRGRRRLAPAERAVFAVEAVFALVTGILLRFLRPDETTKSAATTSVGIDGVPDGVGWARVYKELRTAFFSPSSESSDRGPPPAWWVHEINAVKSRAKELACAPNNTIVGGAAGIEELKSSVEDLTRGLEGLDEAVTGLFRSTLRARDAALESLRAGRTKCK